MNLIRRLLRRLRRVTPGDSRYDVLKRQAAIRHHERQAKLQRRRWRPGWLNPRRIT